MLEKAKRIRDGGGKLGKEFEPDEESYGQESVDEASDSDNSDKEEQDVDEFIKDGELDINKLRLEIAMTLIAEDILKETIRVEDISDLMARYLLKLKIHNKDQVKQINDLNSEHSVSFGSDSSEIDV